MRARMGVCLYVRAQQHPNQIEPASFWEEPQLCPSNIYVMGQDHYFDVNRF